MNAVTFWNDTIAESLNLPFPYQVYQKILNVLVFIFLEEKGIADFQAG